MTSLYKFNKPFQVLSQFTTDSPSKRTLAEFIAVPEIYCAGRLDYDSEGLLLLTNDGRLQNRISHPKFSKRKHYWVQVEGDVDLKALTTLLNGVELRDGFAQAIECELIAEPPALWPRTPPIRERKAIPTSWLNLVISEGRNRQVRRMTAAIGHPTLRLIRHRIGEYELGDLRPGEMGQME